MHWERFAADVINALPALLLAFVVLFIILLALFEWERRHPSIKRYPFRANLLIKRGSPTIHQGCHVIIPARSLEEAQVVAEQIGNLNEASLDLDPGFRI